MPHKTETLALKDPFLDRRTKLLPCQKEMVVYWYKVQGASINSIARMFRVNKRLIQFILFPERLKKNKELRADRGGEAQYYVREEHNAAMKEHRQYKHKTLKHLTTNKQTKSENHGTNKRSKEQSKKISSTKEGENASD